MDFLVLVAIFGAVMVTTFMLNWLALIPWRRSTGQHWTGRARILYPVRISAALNVWLAALFCVWTGATFWRGHPLPLWLLGVLGWLGGVVGNYPFSHEVFPWLKFSNWFRYAIAASLLRYVPLFLLVGAGIIMPGQFGWATLIIASGAALGILWLHFGLLLWVLRLLCMLKPPPERLQRIVAQTSNSMGVQVRSVWLYEIPASYAAALPMTHALLFSGRLLLLLADEEIAAVCAHELGHLSESRVVRARRILGSFALFPFVFLKPVSQLSEEFGPAALALMVAVGLACSLLSRRLSRKMEVRADRLATENEAGAGIYARALERLYEDNLVPAVMGGNRKAHPHLYDRMLAAGITPAYPRPLPPGTFAWNFTLGVLLIVIFFIIAGAAAAFSSFDS